MPRSNWKGMISFGLVSIPIVLLPTENKSAHISFHQIDKRNNARIKYKRINVETGKEVPWEEITRGYEYDQETSVPVPDEILKKVAGEQGKTIDIETFINKNDLDIITITNAYYIIPDKRAEKGYVILRESLKSTNKIGIAKVIIATKEYLSAVMPYDKGMVLCILKYDEEMRKISQLELPNKDISAYKVTKKEIEIAKQLIKSMTSQWRPEKYVDQYQQAIHRWVKETVNQLPHHLPKKRVQAAGKVVDLVDLLKKSLESSKKSTRMEAQTNKNAKKMYKYKPVTKYSRHLVRH